jgi:hypothetical protein
VRLTRARAGLGQPATKATWDAEANAWRCHCGAVFHAGRGNVGGSIHQCPSCGTWWRGRGAANGFARMVPVDDDAMGTSSPAMRALR